MGFPCSEADLPKKTTLLCSPSFLPEVVNDSDVVLIEENKVNKGNAKYRFKPSRKNRMRLIGSLHWTP